MTADIYDELRKKILAFDSLLFNGCSNAHCRIRRPTGMHTNGSCKCMEALRDTALDIAAEADRVKNFCGGQLMPRTVHVFEETGRRCSVCGLPQYATPSGACCANGHGGDPGVL